MKRSPLQHRVDAILDGRRARPKAKRTAAGGYLACPHCGQKDNGFTRREPGVTMVQTVFFDGAEGTVFDTTFDHSRPMGSGTCNECGGVFRVLAEKKAQP